MSGYLGNGAGLYGPSGGAAEITELWYPAFEQGTPPNGLSSGTAGLFPAGVDTQQVFGVQIPDSWTTFDIVTVIQSEGIFFTGTVAVKAYYGTSFGSLSEVGSVLIGSNTITSADNTTVATGVARSGKYGQISVARLGADPSDTYGDDCINYGLLLRKAS